MSDQVIFFFLCFFVLGFLCVVGWISFFLNYYFKTKAYFFYLGYIITTTIYIVVVFIDYGKEIPKSSLLFAIAEYIYDPIQVISYFFHTSFVYYAVVSEDPKFKKMFWLIKIYALLLFIYLIAEVIHFNLSHNVGSFFEISRIIGYVVVLVFLFSVARNLVSNNLKLIFTGLVFFFVLSLLAFWDATINSANSSFYGFQFICLGYVTENSCFAIAFILRIITVDKQKKEDEVLHQKQLVIVEQEMQQQAMQYLGREIHDNVGQKLILASLSVQQLSLGDLAPDVLKKTESINALINNSLAELRLLSKTLTDNEIENKNTVTIVKAEAKEVNKVKSCIFSFNDKLRHLELDYTTKIILLRVIQEFSQNSIKHANCNLITIDMQASSNKLTLCIKDDGVGFNTSVASTRGIGLKNMEKRTTIIGGTFSLQSDALTGTKLLIQIPLKQ